MSEARKALISEVQITYKRKVHKDLTWKISKSTDVVDYFWEHMKDFIDHHEEFYALYLSRSNQILAYIQISKGGINGTVADPRIIFQTALKLNASSIITVHNHPSGNASPSQADINMAKKIKEGGDILDIVMLDTIIITSESYYSFSDEGIL